MCGRYARPDQPITSHSTPGPGYRGGMVVGYEWQQGGYLSDCIGSAQGSSVWRKRAYRLDCDCFGVQPIRLNDCWVLILTTSGGACVFISRTKLGTPRLPCRSTPLFRDATTRMHGGRLRRVVLHNVRANGIHFEHSHCRCSYIRLLLCYWLANFLFLCTKNPIFTAQYSGRWCGMVEKVMRQI